MFCEKEASSMKERLSPV